MGNTCLQQNGSVALKRVVDAGKLKRAVHWVGDARGVNGRAWSAPGLTVGLISLLSLRVSVQIISGYATRF